jgi:hypothetical protein
VNIANGSLVAEINGTNLGASGGGSGLADTYVQPLNLGWHFKRADFNVGYAFTAPTGRYTAGASNNVGFPGTGGNNITSGTTLYITKNKGTSANLFTDWEIHGQRKAASTRGPIQQYNARPGLHHRVGTWSGSSPEEGFQQAAATGIGGV